MPEGDEKRIGHAAADEDGVDPREQMLDEAELVGDLGAAQHGHEGTLGALEDAPEGLELARHEKTRRCGMQDAGDPLRGGVSAMGGGEGVIHIDVGQGGEPAREAGIVGLLLGVKAQVLEQHHLARLEGGRGGLHLGPDAIGQERNGAAE